MKKLVLFLICIGIIYNSIISQEMEKVAIIRCDDIGMNHSVNIAIEEIAKQGFPVSASIMFACPWYLEAVEIIKKYPNISPGVHLTLNSEWENYKWGPIIGTEGAPSLVDLNGYFFFSNKQLLENNPSIHEIEMELRAQIERALNTGIKIDYFDAHMYAAYSTPELRKLIQNLATEYEIGISEWYNEEMIHEYFTPYDEKKESLIEKLYGLDNNKISILLFHPAMDTKEMNGLVDLNNKEMKIAKHRHAEFQILISDEFQNTINENKIVLTNYKEFLKTNPILDTTSFSQTY